MRLSTLALKSIVICVCLLTNSFVSAQNIEDEVNSKLNASDRKKVEKANELTQKGDQVLAKALYPGDKQILEMLNMGETKTVRQHVGSRVDAGEYYRDANSQKFDIYQQNCKSVYANITGDQNLLTPVVKSEKEAIALFKEALEIRKKSEKMSKLKERIPLLFEAENKEKTAINQIQRVLHTYLKHPDPYNKDWFTPSSEGQSHQVQKDTSGSVIPAVKTDKTNEKTNEKTIKKDSINSAALQTTKIAINTANNSTNAETKNAETKNNSPYSATNATQSENVSSDSSLYKLANVNENQVDSFNFFLQQNYPENYDSYLVNYRNLDYSNIQSLRDAWYKYRYGQPEDSVMVIAERNKAKENIAKTNVSQEQTAQNIPITTSDTTKTIAENKQTQVIAKTKNKQLKKQELPVVIYQNEEHKKDSSSNAIVKKDAKEQPADLAETTIANKNKQDKKKKNTDTKILAGQNTINNKPDTIASGFNYKVQVAACRVKIPADELSGIYSGNDKITETYEDGWYKYTVGNYKTYKEACKLRDQTTVSGAFIVAYVNGKRVMISTAVDATPLQPASDLQTVEIEVNKIVFRLQILASKIPMRDSFIKNIYNGPLTVDVIQEEGLYKYSLLAGKKLTDALILANSLNIPGAFVVAYSNNQKIDLYTAIKLTRNL